MVAGWGGGDNPIIGDVWIMDFVYEPFLTHCIESWEYHIHKTCNDIHELHAKQDGKLILEPLTLNRNYPILLKNVSYDAY